MKFSTFFFISLFCLSHSVFRSKCDNSTGHLQILENVLKKISSSSRLNSFFEFLSTGDWVDNVEKVLTKLNEISERINELKNLIERQACKPILEETSKKVSDLFHTVEQFYSNQTCKTKTESKAKLMHHWPMSDLKDKIGGSDLYEGVNFTYVSDQLGRPNSSIHLRKGYLNIPPGVYFDGDFSITFWINFKESGFPKIFDCCNNEWNNVMIEILHPENQISLTIFNEHIFSRNGPTHSILVNEWYHIATVVRGSIGLLYVNGKLAYQGKSKAPLNKLRHRCVIGGDSWGSSNVNAIIDEFKIFKGAMTENEIYTDYNEFI